MRITKYNFNRIRFIPGHAQHTYLDTYSIEFSYLFWVQSETKFIEKENTNQKPRKN